MSDARRNDQQPAMDVGVASSRTPMVETSDDAVLAEVETTRRLVVQTTRDFGQAVAAARAGDFTWEEIAEHVPAFGRAYGAEAAEKLFELASAVRTGQAGRYVCWRCGECEGAGTRLRPVRWSPC